MAESIPNELMCQIFKFLTPEDLDQCYNVCLKWKRVVELRSSQKCELKTSIEKEIIHDTYSYFCLRISDGTIIIALGPNTESISQNGGSNLPLLPYEIQGNSLVHTSNKDVLLCGGRSRECFILNKKEWKVHSTLSRRRENAVAIEMPNGIYLFGGTSCPYGPSTSEFLPNVSNVWEKGPKFPKEMKRTRMKSIHDVVRDIRLDISFTKGIHVNGGHKISNTKLIIVRVRDVLKFNIETKEWSYWNKLKEGRIKGCSVISNGKLVVAGGCDFRVVGFW